MFKVYAQIEMQLGQIERCRSIYQKQIVIFPGNSEVWIEFAEFEA